MFFIFTCVKAAIINIFYVDNGKIMTCNVKGVTHCDLVRFAFLIRRPKEKSAKITKTAFIHFTLVPVKREVFPRYQFLATTKANMWHAADWGSHFPAAGNVFCTAVMDIIK